MSDEKQNSGPILRLFQVKAKPGCAAELIRKFRVTSAEVVRGHPGNRGYFFGQGIETDKDYVVFTSVWRDLEAVKARFGDAWQEAFIPPGYEDLIDECSIRHIDVAQGWHVDGVVAKISPES
ncbi:antibiotic biosynthesis monooxygenase family protein [Lutimaribacter marinistellae]|uniref:Antibiotic biosynthesis monooxygenase family protein n=1 Tax=Lutimaribacter marinistellae TaxID=1820329 RepID=A0ABV7TCY0_9RHOB